MESKEREINFSIDSPQRKRRRRTIFLFSGSQGRESSSNNRRPSLSSPLRTPNKLTLIITSLYFHHSFSLIAALAIHCLFIPFHFLPFSPFLLSFFLFPFFYLFYLSSAAPCISLFNFSSLENSRLKVLLSFIFIAKNRRQCVYVIVKG